MGTWKPDIEEGLGPLYERIADAIERDIHGSRLALGTRLPPHRDLAQTLSVSIGTVTKAYGEAERRGLLSSQVGRGSFVTAAAAEGLISAHAEPIDLAHNFPPVGSTPRHLADALGRLWRHQDFAATSRYTVAEGLESARKAASRWFHRRLELRDPSPGRLIQTNGGQHALSLLLGTMCRSGDTVLCEAATFHGLKLIAKTENLKLEGVGFDADGLVPDWLDKAAAATGSKVLYTIPTLQNPTAITMSIGRRLEIAEVARRRNLLIIEDDAYRAIAGPDSMPPSLADLAPERTFYIASLSKCMSPGLRLAFVMPPDVSWRERLLNRVVATGYAPPSQNALVFAQWVEDGIADAILDNILGEMRLRTTMALRALGDTVSRPGAAQTLHIWLPLDPLAAERASGRALRAGVQVTPPDALLVGEGVSGLRICLGGVADRAVLEHALRIVSQSLGEEVPGRSSAIV
ncbi:PLP-dependent aminotransferase family protein [Mesorhizobium sp. INR15]|uniref:aminotransferase-like domain-containing protein n=1 Tax=Mesorhizobium sp. INR15 TaxID=2654248 RepID=UPI0018969064|nr:PLP-dependent aminotransferase family protein [Mesorhizobium sp. INR15]QPC92624.1 aminotransferase class I/II-fold pyridoxal phosphate-dependent enzyme [Mesorhizobium sp. INR15]